MLLSLQKRNKAESDIKDFMQDPEYICYAVQNISFTPGFIHSTFEPRTLASFIFNPTNPMEYNAWFKQSDGKYTEIIVYNISNITTPPNYEFINYGTDDVNLNNIRFQIGVDFRIAPYIDTSDLPKLDGTFSVPDDTISLFLNDFNDNDDGLSNIYDKKYLFDSLKNPSNATYPITKPESISQYIDTLTNLVHASAAQFTN